MSVARDRKSIAHLQLPGALGDMHREVEWLQPADNYILEYVRRAGKQTPKTISWNVPYGYSTAATRCPTLAEHGLLSRVEDEHGGYELSERGRQYLDGELSPADLRED